MGIFNDLIGAVMYFCMMLICEVFGFCLIIGFCYLVFRKCQFNARRKICRILCQLSAIVVWGIFFLDTVRNPYDREFAISSLILLLTAIPVCNFIISLLESAKLQVRNSRANRTGVKQTLQLAKEENMKRRLENASYSRTAEEMEVVRYFFGDNGCMSDQEYFDRLAWKRNSLASKGRVLEIVGLDESQVSEIYPIYKEEYVFSWTMYSGNINKPFATKKVNGFDISSRYHVAWTLFSDNLLINYDVVFDMDKSWKQEKTTEIFYHDISNYYINNNVVNLVLMSGQTYQLDFSNNMYGGVSVQGLIQKIRESKYM